MSSKPQPRPSTSATAGSTPTVPGTLPAAAAEDDRTDTLRTPPRRMDETPIVVPMLTKDAFRTATGQLTAPPEPADDAPTLLPLVDPHEEDTRKVSIEGPYLGVSEIRIPPLSMPKDMAELLELEGGGSGSARPPAHELRPPTYVSSLSPAERRAHKQEPRRGRLLAGLAIAAAGVVAIGASTLWQPVAEPIVPRRAAAAAAKQPGEAEREPSTAPGTLTSSAVTPSGAEHAIGALPEPLAELGTDYAQKRRRPAQEPKLDRSSLPMTPSRQDVLDAMAPLREELARCAEGRGGVAELMLSVDGSGAVLHAKVVGDYAGTAQGSCIALAARKAHFAPFQQARFSVHYPVAL